MISVGASSSNEFTNECVHLRGALVHHPMRTFGYALDREIWNVCLQTIEVAAEKEAIVLTPDHERRHRYDRVAPAKLRGHPPRCSEHGRPQSSRAVIIESPR